MKAGIITHYDVHNHGAHLQLYALKQKLKEHGYDAKALTYKKNYDFIGGRTAESKYDISIKSIPVYLKYLFMQGFRKTLYNFQKRRVLRKFRKEEALVGEFYALSMDLKAVVIGSDEVFSLEAGLNPWLWGMGVPSKHIVSYAASFGPTTIDFIKQHHAENFVEAGIKGLRRISVRDRNSKLIVKHYSGNDAKIVCDPVLLYEFPQQINDIVIERFVSGLKEKYCIVYSYDSNMNDVETVSAIQNYARKNNLRVYSVAYYHKWCDRNIQVEPLDLFLWFSGAEMVFTDTFHGSVISLATGTQFLTKIRGNKNKLAFLLEQYGVSERLVDSFSEVEAIDHAKIDYKIVNETIKHIRSESDAFLKDALADVNDSYY